MNKQRINKKDFDIKMKQALRMNARPSAGPGFENKVWQMIGEPNPSFWARLSAVIFSKQAIFAAGAAAVIALIFFTSPAVYETGKGKPGAGQAGIAKTARPEKQPAAGQLIQQVKNCKTVEPAQANPEKQQNNQVAAAPTKDETAYGNAGFKFAALPATAGSQKIENEDQNKAREAGIYKPTPGQEQSLNVSVNVYNNIIHPIKGEYVTINYQVDNTCAVSVIIYDRNARIIKTIFAGTNTPGFYRQTWKGDDDGGYMVNAGIYIVHIKTDKIDKKIKLGVIK